jgi:hypothetical protein
MRARPSLTGAVILLALAVTSCTESTTPAFSDIEGVYRLQVAPGASVVLDPEPGSARSVNVTQAVLDLSPAWRFSMSYTLAPSSDGLGVSGSYSHEGSTVGLQYDSGVTQTGALSGNTLTLTTADGQTLEFEKVN